MGNIGSEVQRSINWFLKKDDRFQSAFERAIELFDLTLKDKRWKDRYKEIFRCREVFCTLLTKSADIPNLEEELTSLDKYFTDYAVYARKDK